MCDENNVEVIEAVDYCHGEWDEPHLHLRTCLEEKRANLFKVEMLKTRYALNTCFWLAQNNDVN